MGKRSAFDQHGHYDWPYTFSYQTDNQGEICMVVGGNSIGKTYGLRKQCVKDYLKDGTRFLEIVRVGEELKGSDSVQAGYFDKLIMNNEFPDHVFRTEGKHAYIAKKPEGDERPSWELIGYFAALNTFQRAKKQTFALSERSRIIFDEAIMDRDDKTHRYLQNEYILLVKLLIAAGREDPERPKQLKLYLLGNAVDLTCPYFEELGIGSDGVLPDYGKHFYNQRHVLFDYVQPINAEQRKENTLVGRMLARHEDASAAAFDNSFAANTGEFIEDKPSNAKFQYALILGGDRFGLWLDYARGILYINRKIPPDANIVALTLADNSIDYISVQRNSELMKGLIKMYYGNCIRYSAPGVREGFKRVLSFFGVR